jgi:uncharacterized protein YndB with AHSA1/START domain
MVNSRYAFVTHWAFDAAIDDVWTELSQPEHWPGWWKGVLAVEPLEAADPVTGAGAYYRMLMKSALPYRLVFNVRTTRRERPTTIEARSDGELTGTGLWTLSSTPTGTAVRYDWTVEATKTWMRVLAPIARPIFEWNHDVIMRWGQDGLARRLGSTSRHDRPPSPRPA